MSTIILAIVVSVPTALIAVHCVRRFLWMRRWRRDVEFRMRVMRESVENAARTIGEAFVPAMRAAGESIVALSEAMSRVSLAEGPDPS